MIKAQRKRSITFSSIEPFLFSRSDPKVKEKLRTTSINSIASGIISNSSEIRPRAGTWHGEDNDAVKLPTKIGEEVADLKDFDDEIDSQEVIRQIITEELTQALDKCEYESKKCVEQCTAISQAVEQKVKGVKGDDTKVVVVVYIGEVRDQGIEITSQCLWNPETDSFATSSYRNKSMFALCTVFTVN